MTAQLSKFRVATLAVTMVACNWSDVVDHRVDTTDADDSEAELTKLAFDPSTVRTVKGKVAAVEPFQKMRGTRYGVRVRLLAGDEAFYAYLGPERYLDRNDISVAKDDEVEVTGSVVPGDGRQVIIATEIVKGATSLTLRDEHGRPAWRRWRGRPKT